MMGRQDDGQDQLSYQINLEQLVPEDHLLRYIDQVLDLSSLRDHLAAFYSHTGRPSPKLATDDSERAIRCGMCSSR